MLLLIRTCYIILVLLLYIVKKARIRTNYYYKNINSNSFHNYNLYKKYVNCKIKQLLIYYNLYIIVFVHSINKLYVVVNITA